jgi:hypothetical protein
VSDVESLLADAVGPEHVLADGQRWLTCVRELA